MSTDMEKGEEQWTEKSLQQHAHGHRSHEKNVS
jgi:hypothetical protein